MTNLLRAVKGMDDLFEDDLRTWRHVEHVARETFLAYGFGEIRTPILEETALFVRGVGDGTDIVHKEMFAFEDGALRPENTAGVVRAMLEHKKLFADAYEKVFYCGPMFRRENPQAGRRRQFHQIGCEAFGYAEAACDVEIIALADGLLSQLGIEEFTLHLNSLGDADDRNAYTKALTDYLANHETNLSEDSRRRLRENPLRILDSKDEGDQRICDEAPRIIDFLSEESKMHFQQVCDGLKALGISFVIDTKLVRGLDYYNRTVFEFVCEDGLGSQNTIAAGGRYDGLVSALGGRPTPAVGFAGGIERIVMAIKARGQEASKAEIPLMLIGADHEGRIACTKLAFALRNAGLRVELDLKGRSVSSQMKMANRMGVIFTAVIGSSEIKERKIVLKHMKDGYAKNVRIQENPSKAIPDPRSTIAKS
jgi:histidyl-tRNA synthetase